MHRDIFQTEKPAPKKIVDLTDYDYLCDVKTRAMLAELNQFEIEVLQEIIDNSLTFSINHLADLLGVTAKELTPVLQKFSQLHLLEYSDSEVVVNKDKRKHFELEAVKFEEDFTPDISYVFSLLKNKIPLHVLPNWYSISKSADDMFLSIVEKYFATPETYRKYLSELSFDHPVLDSVVSQILNTPDCHISADKIISDHQLTRSQFEEICLKLEYTFVGYLCYDFNGEGWNGIIRPFSEWNEFYQYQQKCLPRSIDDESVIKTRSYEFPFLRDMSALLQLAQKSAVDVKTIKFEALSGSLPGLSGKQEVIEGYCGVLVEKCLALNLGLMTDNGFVATDTASSWISSVPQDQAVMLYRNTENVMKRASQNSEIYTASHIRSAEKTLRNVADSGWVVFDAFIRSASAPVMQVCGVTLVRKGSKWHYQFPEYSPEEVQLIYDTIFERLFQCGIVDIGVTDDKPCFRVTSFGKSILL